MYGSFLLSKRDPFFLREKRISTKRKKQSRLKLLGLIACNERVGAIIEQKKKQKIVFLGDKVQGYVVKKISHQDVVLTKGKTKRVLIIE